MPLSRLKVISSFPSKSTPGQKNVEAPGGMERATGGTIVGLRWDVDFNAVVLAQGRTDGAECGFSDDDKMAFLKKAQNTCDIVNMEMEALVVSSFCMRVGVECKWNPGVVRMTPWLYNSMGNGKAS